MFDKAKVTVLLAAAGAGKTTQLIQCVEKDLETYRPEELAFVSYTRKGAYEGKDRIVRKFQLDPESLDYFRTLHSLTFNELGASDLRVFNSKAAQRFNEIFGFKLSHMASVEVFTTHDKMLSYYDTIRSGKVDPYEDTGIAGFTLHEYERFTRAYEAFKKKFGYVDYTDCLELFVKRNKPVPVKVAYIDEAQDLTKLQWKVCMVAFRNAEKIYIAGDDYQSIYTYAGAVPKYLVQASSMYSTIKLEQSYRLPVKVYELARAVTDMIAVKVDKDYKPFKLENGLVERVVDRNYLAKKIYLRRDESWLVLFRNNYHIGFFEKDLLAMCVPFHTTNGFCIGERRLLLLKKYYNFRKKGFGNEVTKKTFAMKYNIASFDDEIIDCDLIDGDYKYVVQAYIDKYGVEALFEMAKAPPKILLSTIHKVKGAESKNVALFLDCTQRVYQGLKRDFDSELRTLYVAITRAKDSLYLVRSQSAYGLDEIVDTLVEYSEVCD